MIFKTHKANIKQIKQHIAQIGPVYFHGDGNMYPAGEEDGKLSSQNNVTFSNPKQEESKYRVLFTRVNEVPDTVEELNDMLMAAKNKETLAERADVQKTGIRTLTAVSDESDEDDAIASERKRLADEKKAAVKEEADKKKEAEKLAKAEEKRLADEKKAAAKAGQTGGTV